MCGCLCVRVCAYLYGQDFTLYKYFNYQLLLEFNDNIITHSRTHVHTHTHGRTHAQTHLGHAQTRNLKKFKKLVINQRNYNPLEKKPRFVSETFFFLFLLPSLLGFYLPLSFPCLIFIFSCLLSLQSYFSYARKPR